MGLSSEERYYKLSWALMGWRRELVELQQSIPAAEEPARRTVGKWVQEVDALTGEMVKELNGHSLYWFAGDGEASFAGIISDPVHIRPDALPDTYIVLGEPKHGTISWWSQETSYGVTVRYLSASGYVLPDGLKPLARWWDAFAYVSAIRYAVWRYKDNVFPEKFKERFLRLVGQMVNKRFEVCFDNFTLEGEDKVKAEIYLHLKREAFLLLLKKATKDAKGTAYSEVPYDATPLWEKVREMNAKDLVDLFDKEDRERWAREKKYNEEHPEKPEGPSALFGPPVPREKDEPCPTPTKKSTKKKATTTKKTTGT